ncbi:Ubiquitin carboxyl-terminal hydrolases family 2 [Macleaya cordata]|uniref:ubiquitinyl hydrolase 1 n=1 Tax=Macleaya cordata TaxID=56857 RepID=A0A200PNM6_MACCD|nr:Ubiquitin carboxyl-terminal hydrolases family 2 [Macleaya cordata]
MLVPGDLGFPGLIWGFFFFFGPIIGLVIRRKWRIAVERKMEILRLVAMASEEAERAEIEAAYEYGTVSVVGQYQCALCYSPTTTRCSRCKAVRYCSGKCQIIHWRRGHKDECRPASTSIEFNGPGGDSDRNTVLEGEKESFDNDLDMGSSWDAKPLETFREEPASFESSQLPEFLSRNDDKVGSLADGKGEDIVAEPSGKLVGFVKSASTNSSMDVSVSEFSVSSSPDRSEGTTSDDTGFGELEKKVDINDVELTRSPPSKFNLVDASLNTISCSNKLKQKTPSCNAGEVEHGSTRSSSSSFYMSEVSSISEPSKALSGFCKGMLDSNESVIDVHDDSAESTCTGGGNDMLSDSRNLLQSSFKLSKHAVSSSQSECSDPKTLTSNVAYPVTLENKMHAYGASLSEKTVTSVVRDSPILSSERSASVNSNRVNNSEQFKRKGIRSLSSSDSDGRSSSASVEHSIPNAKFLEADNPQVVASRSSEIAHSSQNASNGLKMSVQKVVQQFKGPKLSKHYGSEAGKQNYKMLFPYELFVKLYNKDKAELHPCGLTNCGNSCYANAVLQCLAFTRPLTAYLLQGLHSKECSKKEWCFTCEFESLIMKAKEGKSPLSPIGILSQLHNIGSHLGHGKEEDAHEFLRYAIDKMQSICLKEAGINAVGPLAEETTLIGLIFRGYLRSKIKCMRCQGKSERYERMMDLTVEIQGDIGTLEEALGQFTATEILDGENKYHCSRCKSYEKAKKKLTVLEAPNVLTIALKRFQSGKFGKLNKAVRFPEVLNLAPYMSGTSDKSPIYSLYAVVVHLDIMNAAFSGHYVCYVKNSQGKWFKIDDSTVKPVELERVLSRGAYMLLYARCSPRAPSLIRNAMFSNESKIKRNKCSGPLSSSHGGKSAASRERPSSLVSSDVPSNAHRNVKDYSYWTADRPTSFETFDSVERRFRLIPRIPKVDSSSSDNSSLLSCSDEGSCSTESTRDSISADELLSDYIFGETGHSWNSPFRMSDDSNSSGLPSPSFSVSDRYGSGSLETSGYPTGSVDETIKVNRVWMRLPQEGNRNEGFRDKGDNPILYSDTTNRCTKLRSSSSSRETDSERRGWGNSLDVKSGVSLRRSTKERTTQAFY